MESTLRRMPESPLSTEASGFPSFQSSAPKTARFFRITFPVGPGLTEHGLRVTFAAEIKRVTGANNDQVAAALGDRDTRMGAHYTRHVEQENKILFLWAQRTRTEQDLENRSAKLENVRGRCTVCGKPTDFNRHVISIFIRHPLCGFHANLEGS